MYAAGLLLGIGLGTLTWFAALSVVTSLARRRVAQRAIRGIDAMSGRGIGL
jgi:hypothetical protein